MTCRCQCSQFVCVGTHDNICSLHPTQRPLFVLTKLNYLVLYPVMNFTDPSECVNVKCLTSWPSDLNWSDSTKLSIRGERRINPRNVGEVAACAYINAKTWPVGSSCRWRKQTLWNAVSNSFQPRINFRRNDYPPWPGAFTPLRTAYLENV